jgi:hypothetical protein
VKFDLYPFQADTLKSFTEKEYIVLLKARQMGISTLVSAYALWLMVFHPSSVCGAISLKTDVCKEFVSRIRFANSNLPSFLRLTLVEDNRLSLTFSNNSRFIANSTSERGSASWALSLLILDEAALIPNCQDLWTSSQPSLSNGGKAIVLSTPRGNGGFFHDCYMGAESGTSKFYPIKLPWYLHPEHDQVWRLSEGAKMGNPRLAKREYDCDWENSGDTLIEGSLIEEYRKGCIDPIEKRNNIGLWVWEKPIAGRDYFIMADVASGYSADNSTAQILDDTGIQVAEFRWMSLDEYSWNFAVNTTMLHLLWSGRVLVKERYEPLSKRTTINSYTARTIWTTSFTHEITEVKTFSVALRLRQGIGISWWGHWRSSCGRGD